MKVSLTGGGVVGLAAVAGVAYLGYKVVKSKDAVIQAVNPMSDQNLAYKGASAASRALGISGTHSGYSYDDHIFAAVDLINPFNDSDSYAEKVWGLGDD
jgi:UDP-glucose 6-dehydrogenase